MKSYIAPQLTTTGSVVESTRQVIPGIGDPLDKTRFLGMAPGSVGFQL
jgi:hypothetical protein